MKYNYKGICPECKKENILNVRQVHGMRLITELRNEQYYDVECPDCKTVWYEKVNVVNQNLVGEK